MQCTANAPEFHGFVIFALVGQPEALREKAGKFHIGRVNQPCAGGRHDGRLRQILERRSGALLCRLFGAFFPEAHAGIDWTRRYESLDTELRQAFFDARRLWREIAYLDLANAETSPLVDSESPATLKTSKIAARRAFAVATLGLITVCLLLSHPLAGRYFSADYTTSVGEIKSLHLSDGSTVHLNTGSMIAENFTEHERNLELLAGEAEFEVAHDQKRPFVVTAGNGRTRALGTRFIVQYTHDKVQVSVLENAVEISSDHHAPVTLNSGYKLEYRGQGLFYTPETLSKSEPNVWRTGNLKFDARPLKEIISEIDRYLPGRTRPSSGGIDLRQWGLSSFSKCLPKRFVMVSATGRLAVGQNDALKTVKAAFPGKLLAKLSRGKWRARQESNL